VLKEFFMRNLMMVGVLLVVVGIAGLVIQNVRFTETKNVLDVGPLHVNSEEQHNVPIPTIAGIVAVLAGLGLIFAARRKA
jgi:LPXTG-motif cell wall-anchored protein